MYDRWMIQDLNLLNYTISHKLKEYVGGGISCEFKGWVGGCLGNHGFDGRL